VVDQSVSNIKINIEQENKFKRKITQMRMWKL